MQFKLRCFVPLAELQVEPAFTKTKDELIPMLDMNELKSRKETTGESRKDWNNIT